jgi:hypothetical protein
MKAREIDTFFSELDKRVKFPLQVILTGGAAGILMGVNRVTNDIDFEVHLRASRGWEQLEQACLEVANITSISPQYADDIDRWSSIPLLEKKTQLYKKIGKIEIRILEPAYWAIGKLTRFLSSDVEDMVYVFKEKKVNPLTCARIWGLALKKSSPSLMQSNYKRQVDLFFDRYATKIWGKKANPEKLKDIFAKAASRKS